MSERGIQWIDSIGMTQSWTSDMGSVRGIVVVVTVRVVLGFRVVLGTVNLNNKGDGRLSDIETMK